MKSASAISTLFMLYSQHQDASAKYREAANLLESGTMTDYFEELAEYHFAQSKSMHQVLHDLSPSPMPMPNMDAQKSWLSGNWDAVKKAVENKEMQRLLTFAHQNEEALSSAYRSGLETHGLPEGIEQMLRDLHQKQLDAVLQTERYETVQDIRLGNIKA